MYQVFKEQTNQAKLMQLPGHSQIDAPSQFPKSSPKKRFIDHENHHRSKQLKPGENHFPYPTLPGFPDPSPKNRLVDFPLSRRKFPKSSPASFPISGT
jgi:hypothetical protein